MHFVHEEKQIFRLRRTQVIVNHHFDENLTPLRYEIRAREKILLLRQSHL
jgi:hypothetical protein